MSDMMLTPEEAAAQAGAWPPAPSYIPVGDLVAKILAACGFKAFKGCGCAERRRWLNRWAVPASALQWVRRTVQWMRERKLIGGL